MIMMAFMLVFLLFFKCAIDTSDYKRSPLPTCANKLASAHPREPIMLASLCLLLFDLLDRGGGVYLLHDFPALAARFIERPRLLYILAVGFHKQLIHTGVPRLHNFFCIGFFMGFIGGLGFPSGLGASLPGNIYCNKFSKRKHIPPNI